MQRNVKHALVILVAAPLALMTSLNARASSEENAPGNFDVVQASSASRADVTADYLAAQRAGLLPKGDGDTPQVAAEGAGKSRAQVTAEFLEAQRLGLVARGDGDMPQATAEQERMIEIAGLHAVDSEIASK